ncbi:MAG TPA: SRPBCC family protein, partial [Candidatus Dormibacteraeota bacterium]|nr:SRPBCC family protein [Candidatus Dormibacteraeota bacterium]
KGTRYRYHLDLPGTRVTLEVEQDVYQKPKKCAGRFIKGPLKGTWTYTYSQRKDGSTRLTYEMDYELTGLLRFAGGLLGPQYAAGIHKNMDSLKRYIESGKGPKAHG